MFRNENMSDIDPKHFGAGSIIKEGQNNFLVVRTGGSVVLLDLQSFKLIGTSVPAEDPNFLTNDEARKLIAACFDQATYSDFEFFPTGLKLTRFGDIPAVGVRGITKM